MKKVCNNSVTENVLLEKSIQVFSKLSGLKYD